MELLRFLSTVICAVLIATGAASGEDVYKVGGRVSFRPDNFVPPPVTSIIWKHINTAGTTVKAIEWDEGEILIPNPRFQNITTVDEKTGQITITNLKVEHSGVYTLDINSKEQQQRFNLTVEEPVPKPVIKVEKIKDNPDVVYLACNYSHKIIWDNSAREVLKISKLHPTGESITVQKKEGNLDNVYTCTLKNRVSEETSDPVYKNKLFKEDSIIPAIVGAIFGVIIIIIILIVLYLVLESVYKYVNTHCPCIESSLGKLDCFLKKADAEGQSISVAEAGDSNGAVLKSVTKQANAEGQSISVAEAGDSNGTGTKDDKDSKETDPLNQEKEKADQQQQQ